MSSLWDRYTDGAKHAVYLAQQEAVSLGDDTVGEEHILFGILALSDDTACRVLSLMGYSVPAIFAEVQKITLRGPGRTAKEMSLNVSGKRVVDEAYAEAMMLNDPHIGTEHLLLGILSEPHRPISVSWRMMLWRRLRAGVAKKVLRSMGIELEAAREAVKSIRGDHLLRSSQEPHPFDELLRPASSAPVDVSKLVMPSEFAGENEPN